MTTHTLTCKDLGMDTCVFSVTSEDKSEVKKLASEHAMDKHSDKMAGMSEEDKAGMDAKMDSVITEGTA